MKDNPELMEFDVLNTAGYNMASELSILLLNNKKCQTITNEDNFNGNDTKIINTNNYIINEENNNYRNSLPSNRRKPSFFTYKDEIIKLILLKSLILSVPCRRLITIILAYLIENNHLLIKLSSLLEIDSNLKFKKNIILILNQKCNSLFWIEYPNSIYDNINRINCYESFGYYRKTQIITKGFNGDNTKTNSEKYKDTKGHEELSSLLLLLLFNVEQFIKTPMDISYNNSIYRNYYQINKIYENIYSNEYENYSTDDDATNSKGHQSQQQQQQQHRLLQLQLQKQDIQPKYIKLSFLLYSSYYYEIIINNNNNNIKKKHCSENCNTKLCCHKIRLDINDFNINVNAVNVEYIIICCNPFIMYQQFNNIFINRNGANCNDTISQLLLLSKSTTIHDNRKYLLSISFLLYIIILAFKKLQSSTITFSSCEEIYSKRNANNVLQYHQNYETIQQFQHDKSKFTNKSAKTNGIKCNELSKFYNNFEFIKYHSNNSDTNIKKNYNSKLGRNYCCYTFSELYKILQFLLPIFIIFNMLPVLHAVASDFDASELRGGPNPNPRPWIPVVAYLEPLPRPTKSPKCDQTFVSRVGGPQNGTFSAPLLHNPTNHSRQCLYIFLAGPGQRVEVVFTSFNLRGNPPDGSAVGELPACVHEYMDIYAEVQSSDPADLINSPFGGRYCGPIPPRRRISMYRAIALSFFTNKNSSSPDLFEGRYTFLNASEYEIGIPIAGSPCSYTITPSMSINKTGALISPTYPGAYPKDMSCTYQFLGESNQRVRLEFRDFDLFFGGPHCPFDYVKVYDGPDNSSALIGTYCGQQRNLVLYSSESSLFVHFFTLPRTANTQNRGFKGIYEFSESFVKLDFIRQNDGIHIRGSECDQKILSKKESTGHVFSPNYPYPYIPKTVCRYFIYGMQDAQHLERVRLEFSIFEIPKVENKDKSETNCSDGYLKIYLKGQETADAYDKFDYELCGNETTSVVSDGPRLAMVFSSGELQGRGFKAKYIFETEYKIPGTAAPDGSCSFTYRSTSRKKGEFNSPRYPSNYPSDTNCSYLFLALPNEQVTIVFDHFKIKADNVSTTGGAYGSTSCFEDWLEMYVIYKDGADRFLGRYCHLTAPGPVESPRGSAGLRIMLHTDQENVASGFKARYVFEVAKSEFGDCGGNYSGQDSGIITSPGYPAQYKAPARGLASSACNWYITARIGYRISVHFEFFAIEGEPASRGCAAAVLRLWMNLESEAPPVELCGEKGLLESWHYISQGQSVRISFTTTDKTIGAQGFRIVWTEIQDSGPGPPSSITLLCESTYHFQCNSGYCIADRLRCDGVKNCGPGDDSDELHCTMEVPKEDHVVLIICSMAGGLFLTCLLCILCHHRRKRRRRRHLGLHRNAAHYDSTTSATGLSSSRRHLQSGSLSGSLHGINSGTLIIPPAPLPPTSVPPPPHICIAGAGSGGAIGILNGIDDDDDDDDDDENGDDDNETPNLYINDVVHYDDDDPLNGESV